MRARREISHWVSIALQSPHQGCALQVRCGLDLLFAAQACGGAAVGSPEGHLRLRPQLELLSEEHTLNRSRRQSEPVTERDVLVLEALAFAAPLPLFIGRHRYWNCRRSA